MRAPKNKAERIFWNTITKRGWTATKRGWPDFVCYKNGLVILVEVKRKRGYRLKREQRKLMLALAQLGVKCYRFNGQDRSFEKILPPEAL